MGPVDNNAPITVETAIEQYIDSVEAGNSRKNFRSALARWRAWLEDERGVTALDDLEVLDCRRYARHLKRRTRDGELKAGTATTYYAYVRAFLTFCVADEFLDANPAKAKRATDELPEDLGDADRQFWREEERRAILRFVDDRADRALDGEADVDRERAFRDRAVVYLLGLSGVRGAEVFAAPADDKRTGIAWGDVRLDDGAVRVLGKSREYEYAQLPARAGTALERYKRVLDPPTDEWPVFPSAHAPSKYRAVREQLAERDVPDDEVEAILDGHAIDAVLREYEVVPPALSTNGARNLMKRLCEEADVGVDGDYLKPHGARRGLGHELYANGHAELAQSALRHASIETTHKSYSDIQAAETAKQVDDILDE
ncbi:tyrosine-type recombinase/integrase [Candidatus Halobonum tyrrellensis]|uniref:Integrase family protein n=1 Tax=Candidatus Halobonum tyrrellensis G22 TaxID=1324957 RepID=V4J314_9EURY|nr:tyrosine-type recombinase/integrase [Candidatus Halobonum tyrrellensis]ESP89787.1 integrase family protein [Candidatus Halobonum tyrrellensis G22]